MSVFRYTYSFNNIYKFDVREDLFDVTDLGNKIFKKKEKLIKPRVDGFWSS